MKIYSFKLFLKKIPKKLFCLVNVEVGLTLHYLAKGCSSHKVENFYLT